MSPTMFVPMTPLRRAQHGAIRAEARPHDELLLVDDARSGPVRLQPG